MEYGTGAIFGCPGHDQRDLDFARKYDLDVIPVVAPHDSDLSSFSINEKSSSLEAHIFFNVSILMQLFILLIKVNYI